MGCNCKNAQKIKEANKGKNEKSLLEKLLYYFKKNLLLIFALLLAIIVTPIILVIIAYTLVFKGGGNIPMPNKFIKMLNRYNE